MLNSGVDLVRTSAHQAERIERLKIVESVGTKPNVQQEALTEDGETQNALRRFARFLNEQGQKRNPSQSKPKSPQKEKPTPSQAQYSRVLAHLNGNHVRGTVLNIYA